jgi:hypothetical protein
LKLFFPTAARKSFFPIKYGLQGMFFSGPPINLNLKPLMKKVKYTTKNKHFVEQHLYKWSTELFSVPEKIKIKKSKFFNF